MEKYIISDPDTLGGTTVIKERLCLSFIELYVRK